MRFLDRIKFGWRLGRQSIGVVWNDKTLMLFPMISGVCAVLVILAVTFAVGPTEIARAFEQLQSQSEAATQGESSTLVYILSLFTYFLVYITSSY